jgi:arylsulfatase A-like enzyme
MKLLFYSLLSLLGVISPSILYSPPLREQVITIVLTFDDAGIGDFNVFAAKYGRTTPHNTPNFNAFAQRCKMLTAFATHEKCTPTRNRWRVDYPLYLVGEEGNNFEPYEFDRGGSTKGYSVAEACRKEGIYTYHGGKWHIGTYTNRAPMFYDNTYSLLSGSGPYYQAPRGVNAADKYDTWENGNPIYYPGEATRTIVTKLKTSSNTKVETEVFADNREKAVKNNFLSKLNAIASTNRSAFFDVCFTTGHDPNESEIAYLRTKLIELYNKGTNLNNYTDQEMMIGLRKAQIEYFDDFFDEIVGAIDDIIASGKKVNLLIFSDNPIHDDYITYNEPLTGFKGRYQSSIFNMALFFSSYLPYTPNTTYDHLTSINDVFPTLIDLMDIPIKTSGYGRSFVDEMNSGNRLYNDWEYVSFYNNHTVVRAGAVQIGNTIYQVSTDTTTVNSNNPSGFPIVYDFTNDYQWTNNLLTTPIGVQLMQALNDNTNDNNYPQDETNTPQPVWYDPTKYFQSEFPYDHEW